MKEPPEQLKQMYCDYEDFIKNCNGFCSTDDGYCGCLECMYCQDNIKKFRFDCFLFINLIFSNFFFIFFLKKLDAAKDIIRANAILRRKEWMDAKLSAYKEIDYQGPDLLLCPEAKDEYHYAARSKFS